MIGRRVIMGLVVGLLALAAMGGEKALRRQIGGVIQRNSPEALLADVKKYDAAIAAEKIDDKLVSDLLRGELLSKAGRRLAALAESASDAKKKEYRAQARRWLVEADKLLTQVGEALEEKHLDIQDAILEKNEKANFQKNSRWRALAIRRNYVMYLSAWTQLALAPLQTNARERQAAYRAAAEAFEPFAGKGYSTNTFVMDGFLGQAVALQKLGRAREVLALLEQVKGQTPNSYLQQFALLRVKSQLDLGDITAAERAAETYFQSQPAGKKLTDIEATMRLEQLKCLVSLLRSNPSQAAVYSQRRDAIAKMLEKRGGTWAKEVAELLGKKYVDPAERLNLIKKRFLQKEYALSIKECGQWLKEPSIDDLTKQMVLYIRHCAYWNQRDFYNAYQDGRAFLHEFPSSPKAEEILERTITAAHKTAQSAHSPKVSPKELEALCRSLRKIMTGTRQKLLINETLALLLIQRKAFRECELLLDQSIEMGGGFMPRYQKAICVYCQWEPLAASQNLMKQKEVLSLLTRQKKTLVDLFEWCKGKTLTGEQKTCLQTAEGMAIGVAQQYLASNQPDKAKAWMKVMGGLPGFDEKSKGWVQLEIIRLLHEGKTEDVLRMVRRLLQMTGKQDSPALARVLLSVIGPVKAKRNALAAEKKDTQARAMTMNLLKIYELLIQNLENDANSPLRSKEHALRYNYAGELEAAKSYTQAIAQYEWLRKNTDKKEAGRILQATAACYQSAQQYAKAIAVWRTLAKGLKSKTDEWYHANYELIHCYQLSGNTVHARKLLDYFILKHPEVLKGEQAKAWIGLEKSLPPLPAESVK